MPIYTIAQYQVKPSGAEKVKRAIEEFVRYVKANEPGTRVYAAWQQKDDPTRFVHFFIFEDAAAHNLHSKSAAVKRFESIYRPELVGGDVVFTDYDLAPMSASGNAGASSTAVFQRYEYGLLDSNALAATTLLGHGEPKIDGRMSSV